MKSALSNTSALVSAALCLAIWIATGLVFANILWVTTSIPKFGAGMLTVVFGLLSALMAYVCVATVAKAKSAALLSGYLGVFALSALPVPAIRYGTSLLKMQGAAAVPVVLVFDVIFIAALATLGRSAIAKAEAERAIANNDVQLKPMSSGV
ncbi:hypothetical protein H9P43_001987 [Blastocladiella emersonii ATCC 22665]|nr:hypothetical protein H9P43_001987 [Blastocladiella emersonii ATCC 22665]